MLVLYLICATVNHYYKQGRQWNRSEQYSSKIQAADFHVTNPLDLGGFSFIANDFVLYVIVCGLCILSIISWIKLVWFDSDPGIIDSRDQSFDEV